MYRRSRGVVLGRCRRGRRRLASTAVHQHDLQRRLPYQNLGSVLRATVDATE